MTTPTTAVPEAPRRRAIRFTPLRAVAVVVVMLLLAEGAMRSIESRLPDAKAGDQVEVELKWDQIKALHAKGQRTDVVFFGNSAMDAAVDPAVWARSSQRHPLAYNASLLGQPYDSMNRWVDDFVLDEMRPDIMVVGVTPYDVPVVEIQKSSRQIIESSFSATLDGLRPSALSRLDDRFSDWSALVRDRSALRSPGTLWQAARDTALHHPVPPKAPFQPVTLPNAQIVARTPEVWRTQLLLPRGGNANYHGVTAAPTKIDFAFDAQQQAAFRASTTTRSQLAALTASARSHGVGQVVFVIPPMLPDAYLPLTGDNTHVFAAIRRIGQEARQMGVAVFDFSTVKWPESDFADTVHLNGKGSERFSRLFASYLDQL